MEPLFKVEAEMSPFLSPFSKGASVDGCELGSGYDDSTWPSSNEKSAIAFITPGESLQAAGVKHTPYEAKNPLGVTSRVEM